MWGGVGAKVGAGQTKGGPEMFNGIIKEKLSNRVLF